MSTPKTAKVANAVTHFTDLDLSSQHLTTANFMEFNCSKIMELVPKQSVDMTVSTFTRLAPMPLPTYGNADINTRAFFVPMRTIMRGWNEFIDDTDYIDANGNSFVPYVPQIYNSEIVRCLSSAEYATETSSPTFDIEVFDAGGQSRRYIFTPKGKYAYKLLCSLGYRVVFDLRAQAVIHSALPLLAVMRVYSDWYYPSAYVDDTRSISIRKWFIWDNTDNIADFPSRFVANELDVAFDVMYRVAYDSDYFVSAWDNPVAPNGTAYSPISVNDTTTEDSAIINTETNGTPVAKWSFNLSQFAVDALKAATDYMKRHQLAGARVLDRYLARWGVRLPDAKLNRSTLVAQNSVKIQFGDVTSTSDTGFASLGSYAGKGIGRQELNVQYSTDEYGYLIVISTIVPKTAYYQGTDRMTFHTSRLDFYTPEFDALGVQALATRELYVPTRGEMNVNMNDAVFGFVPRYGEYKRGYDNMTGDLVLKSKNAGLEAWSLMRDVSSYFQSDPYDEVTHGINFVDADDSAQYNRIFNITDVEEDKFYIIHNFSIQSRFPGKSMYDSYEFREEDKANKVDIDINGVRAN